MLFGQHLVNELNANGTLAYCASDALRAVRADVAHGENPWPARLEEKGRSIEGPPRHCTLVRQKVRTGLDEALFIERDAPSQPTRIRVCARHDEDVTDFMACRNAVSVTPSDVFQMVVAF